MYPGISITGSIGITYRIEYATEFAPADWQPLVTNRLDASPFVFIDYSAPPSPRRFYRTLTLSP